MSHKQTFLLFYCTCWPLSSLCVLLLKWHHAGAVALNVKLQMRKDCKDEPWQNIELSAGLCLSQLQDPEAPQALSSACGTLGLRHVLARFQLMGHIFPGVSSDFASQQRSVGKCHRGTVKQVPESCIFF